MVDTTANPRQAGPRPGRPTARPNEEADRLWLQASQLRLIADDIEARAATLRSTRTPLDHAKYFRWLAERDCIDAASGIPCDHRCYFEEGQVDYVTCAFCDYCGWSLHPHDRAHRHEVITDGRELLEPFQCCIGPEGARYNSVCAHVEHRVPVARGGTNELGNLVLACVRCNQEKGTLTDVEYLTVRRLVFQAPRGDVSGFADIAESRIGRSLVAVVADLLPERTRPAWWADLEALCEERLAAWWIRTSESDVF